MYDLQDPLIVFYSFYSGFMKKDPSATGDFMKKVLLATWTLRDR